MIVNDGPEDDGRHFLGNSEAGQYQIGWVEVYPAFEQFAHHQLPLIPDLYIHLSLHYPAQLMVLTRDLSMQRLSRDLMLGSMRTFFSTRLTSAVCSSA